MSIEANKSAVRRLIEEGFNQNNDRVIDELVSPSLKTKEGESMKMVGIEGFKALSTEFHTAFPDGKFVLEDIIAEGNKVVTWATFTGTHEGPLQGLPASGRRVSVIDIDLYFLEDGKVAEIWPHFDQFGMMQQLGVMGAGEEPQ
jgi:steroid delta-isomerase-like uncharacterized protein